MVVTFSHLNGALPKSRLFESLNSWGGHGVDVFFVISGYLITHLLLRERERFAAISLKKFYLRRVQRIIPAYAFFLLTALVLLRFGIVYFDPRQEWLAITYTLNLVPPPASPVLQPVWSLCVEEHFYLLWPSAVAFLSWRRQIAILFTVILAAVPIRCWLELNHGPLDPAFFTLTRLDTIAAGCILALFLSRPVPSKILKRFLRVDGLVWMTLFLYILSATYLSRSGKYQLLLQHAVEAFLIAIMTGALVERPGQLLGKVLNLKPLITLGMLSYSIYLGQFILIDIRSISLGSRFAFLALYAVFSFYLIESPVLRFNRKSQDL
ncbi:MAG: acyltransferase [Acidobacteriota bacterium]|nr:acyltransferase [Acidobacteriota bacterium]